jgi:hypothetical protein
VSSDANYFAQRYREERKAAEIARCKAARIAHLDLAIRYALRSNTDRQLALDVTEDVSP